MIEEVVVLVEHHQKRGARQTAGSAVKASITSAE
jgi:hypothetical protein